MGPFGKFVEVIINMIYELFMREIPNTNNQHIVPYIVFTMILNNHISIYILNIVDTSQNWKSHYVLSEGSFTL